MSLSELENEQIPNAISSTSEVFLEKEQTPADNVDIVENPSDENVVSAVSSSLLSPLDLVEYADPSFQNIFHFIPKDVNLKFLELGKIIKKKIALVNHSGEAVRYTVLPPQTPFFKIEFTKKVCVILQFAINCFRNFSPLALQ
jgi:hypothetical protein